MEEVEVQNIRVTALERLGEMRKRMIQDKEDSGSKKRRRSGDVMDWLREKVKVDTQMTRRGIKGKERRKGKSASQAS